MEQLARPARGAGREVTGFNQSDAQTSSHGIECAAATCHTSADDQNVEVVVGESVEGICASRRTEW